MYCFQAKCLANTSEMAFYRGDIEASWTSNQDALILWQELQHLTNIGLTLYMLGKIEKSRSNLESSIRYYQEAVPFLEKAGAYKPVGVVLTHIGNVSLERCDFSTAREQYQRVLDMYRDLGAIHSQHAAYAHVGMGNTAAALYDSATAVSCIDTAFKILKRDGSVLGTSYCRMTYGDLALLTEPKSLHEAESFYLQALTGFSSSRYVEQEALCHTKLGVLEIIRARTLPALRHVVVGMALYQKISSPRGQANALLRLGDIYLVDGDKETALTLYRATYPVCRRFDARRDVADCLRGIGEILHSRHHLGEALLMYEQTGDSKGTEICRTKMQKT